jgi:diguanylate cyclase (GGDEF)-like protein
MTMDELELRQAATNDSLTGALSRRAFKEEASRATALALRHHNDLSCIALDIDHFKQINDTFGHAAGDVVLAGTVSVCLKYLRDTDLMGRLGGEEFAIVLPNTGATGALTVAEKLRSSIAESAFKVGPEQIHITASFGVASLDPATRDIETLLSHADKALYEAKDAGRNRCVAWRSAVGEIGKQRRRVLKGGKILFNGGASSMDCTVRSLSEEGAGLDVSSSIGVPRRFDLSIPSDDMLKACRVILNSEKHLDVAFC